MSPLSRRDLIRSAGGALSASLLFGATGCGSGSPAQATGPATLNVLLAPVAFETVYIAQDQGFFEKHDLTVKATPGGTADAQIPQLLSGQAQIAMSGGVAMINAASRGTPVSITLGSLNSVPPAAAGLVVLDDSPIRSTADLAGRKVGLSGLKDTTQLGTMLSAEANGIDPATITFVELPIAGMIDALKQGTVDAVYLIGPYFRVDGDTGMRLVEPTVLVHLANGPAVVFGASKQYLAENGPVVERFNAAIVEAVDYANANQKAIRDVDDKHTKQPPQYNAIRAIPPFTTRVDREATKATAAAMRKFGFIDNVPDIGAVIAPVCPTA